MRSTGAWPPISSATPQRQPSPDLPIRPPPAIVGPSATQPAPAGRSLPGARLVGAAMVVLRCRRRPCCAASGNAPQAKLGDGLEAGGGRGHTPADLLNGGQEPLGCS